MQLVRKQHFKIYKVYSTVKTNKFSYSILMLGKQKQNGTGVSTLTIFTGPRNMFSFSILNKTLLASLSPQKQNRLTLLHKTIRVTSEVIFEMFIKLKLRFGSNFLFDISVLFAKNTA